jgi:predicted GIY-YIG superfamily endonuclease
MFYVYILRSESQPEQTYIGFTADLKQRLQTHNQGGSAHTAKFVPWQIEFYCAFKHESRALDFERYLKSHSGKAFANKRLIQMAREK